MSSLKAATILKRDPKIIPLLSHFRDKSSQAQEKVSLLPVVLRRRGRREEEGQIRGGRCQKGQKGCDNDRGRRNAKEKGKIDDMIMHLSAVFKWSL
jgi:hypothetical protein